MRDYSIKSDINTEGQLEFIEKYIGGCFMILFEAAEHDRPMMFDEEYNVVSAEGTYKTAYEAADAVLDLGSLANMVILEELVHNNDVGAGSFYIAVDFTGNSIYRKLTFMAPWDFNWAYEGDADGGYYASTFQYMIQDVDRSNGWYILAMKTDWFTDIVRAKWAELNKTDALKTTLKKVFADCKDLENDLGDDAWKIDMARNIYTFVAGRIKWLDKQWL